MYLKFEKEQLVIEYRKESQNPQPQIIIYNENMSKENELTIEVYEKYGDKYLDRNAEGIKHNQRTRMSNKASYLLNLI